MVERGYEYDEFEWRLLKLHRCGFPDPDREREIQLRLQGFEKFGVRVSSMELPTNVAENTFQVAICGAHRAVDGDHQGVPLNVQHVTDDNVQHVVILKRFVRQRPRGLTIWASAADGRAQRARPSVRKPLLVGTRQSSPKSR